jgi:hypothetical protein
MEELTIRISAQVWRVDSLIFGLTMLASVFFYLWSSDAFASKQETTLQDLASKTGGGQSGKKEPGCSPPRFSHHA